MTDTVAVFWPGSHKAKINPGGQKYYKLQREDLVKLEKRGCVRTEVPLPAGSLAIFVGGSLAQGSRAVAEGEPMRLVTYASLQQIPVET